MNLATWLQEATRELPPGVQARVGAETLAHVQDAGLATNDDVTVLLGRPAEMRRALGRLYMKNDDLARLREPVRSVTWATVAVGVLGALAAVLVEAPAARLLGLAVVLVVGGTLTWALRRASPLLRAYLRPYLWMGLMNALLWLRWVTGGWFDQDSFLLVSCGLPVLWLVGAAVLAPDFQKLRRTLRIEEARL